MERVQVQTAGPYEVLIGRGIRRRTEFLRTALPGAEKVLLVSDSHVAALYGAEAETLLRAAGFEPFSFVFQAGEASKNLAEFGKILEKAAACGLTRSDAFLALGGGVTGDLAGFAAASYLRGVRFVQFPTTLLAAEDASVGGKTGIDLTAGKNLAGAFHQPSLVLCDTEYLDTLPERERRCGMAEAIKTAMVGSAELFDRLESGAAGTEEIIARCVRLKAALVEEDETDLGGRRKLNFGHTLGHAAELLGGGRILHGEAVAMGMAAVTESACCRGICSKETLDRLTALLRLNGLPVKLPFGREELAQAASRDKKRLGGRLTLVLPEKIGSCRLETIPAEELIGWIPGGAS